MHLKCLLADQLMFCISSAPSMRGNNTAAPYTTDLPSLISRPLSRNALRPIALYIDASTTPMCNAPSRTNDQHFHYHSNLHLHLSTQSHITLTAPSIFTARLVRTFRLTLTTVSIPLFPRAHIRTPFRMSAQPDIRLNRRISSRERKVISNSIVE